MRPLPLRTSLTLLYTALLALLVTAVAVGYHQLLVRQVDRDATAGLEELVRGLHGYVQLRDGRPSFVYDSADSDAAAFVEEATRFYQFFDLSDNRLVVQSRGFDAAGLDYGAAEVSAFATRQGVHDVQTAGGRLRISSSLVALAAGQRYLLQVGLPLDRFDRAIARLERALLWGIAASLLASLLIGRWMAGLALAPLSRLAAATHAIDIDSLDRRLPVRGAGDELDEVATGFNAALDRVDRAVGEMRQFSAALAHELRTPLAVLRGETELALKGADTPEQARGRLEGQLEEFDRLNGLITQILTLARAESGQLQLVMAPLDLGAVARRSVEQMEIVGEARGVSLGVQAPAALTVNGDEGWLRRLLLILLDNAIKFTPEGGRVGVAVSREGEVVRLDVTDTGIGIAADALPHLIERFYRADPARSRQVDGAGLGLALAKWIADRHHATLAVRSQPDQGTTVTVRIPLWRPGPATRPPSGRDPGPRG